MNLVKYLEGKKTFIVAGVTAVYNVLVVFHALSSKDQLAINGVLAGGYVTTLRAAIKKIETKLPAPVDAVINQEVEAVTGEAA